MADWVRVAAKADVAEGKAFGVRVGAFDVAAALFAEATLAPTAAPTTRPAAAAPAALDPLLQL